MKGVILKRLERNNERGYIKEKGVILKRLEKNNERGYI